VSGSPGFVLVVFFGTSYVLDTYQPKMMFPMNNIAIAGGTVG